MKIKIVLLLLFLIVLFTLLRIKKLEKKNIYLTLTKNLEYFQDQNDNKCKDLDIKTFSGEKFENCFRDSFINSNNAQLQDPKLIINYNKDGNVFQQKDYPTNPTINLLGCIFDSLTDDIIAFEGYRLKRYQLRPQRILDGNYQPTFSMEFRELDTIEDENIKLFYKYVDKLKDEFSDEFSFIGNEYKEEIYPNKNVKLSNDFFNRIKGKLDDLINADEDIKITKIIGSETKEINFIEITIEEKETVESILETDDNKKKIKKKKIVKKITTFKDFLKELTNIFYKFNNKFSKCYYDLPECSIDYQREMPKFYLNNSFTGISHNFDDSLDLIQDSMGIFTNINPDKNDFKKSKYEGTFKNVELPEKFNASNIGFGSGTKKKGYVYYEGKDSKNFYKLPNELVNIGVGMVKPSKESDLVLVPDPYNNRIQVYEMESKNFIYKNQFGNLDTTVKRSFPTFEGNGNELEYSDFMYEPLVDMTNESSGNKPGITGGIYTNVLDNYKCDNTSITLTDLLTNDLNTMENYCNNDYRKQHLDVHSFNILENVLELEPRQLGHFNYLKAEFERTKDYDTLNNKYNYGNFNDPNYIDYKKIGTRIESNAIVEATLLFRKTLYKNIKLTHLGHQFGQLFRPRSIAVDEQDSKYYVVDTYHHCIQCFDKYTYKCEDYGKDTPNNKFYLYEMNDTTFKPLLVQSNDIKNYNNSYLYSLGSRMLVISYSANQDVPTTFGDHSYTNLINTQEGKIWAERYGQNIKKGNEQTVYLTRWVSRDTSNTPTSNTPVVNNNSHPQFFSQDLDNTKQSSGCGEFFYPSDIVIFEEKKKKENGIFFQFLMVTDMGNNRVSIFRKRLISNNIGKRFRFYRFLDETNDNIKTPLSITVNTNLGKVYVLNGKFYDTDKRHILVYSPLLDGENIKYTLIYKIVVTKNATKIRIDDRGFIVVSENNRSKMKIIKDIHENRIDYQDEDPYNNVNRPLAKQKFKFEKPIIRLNSVFFNLELIPKKNEDFRLLPDNLNRFRIVLQRKNDSLKHSHYEYKISPEFKYDYKFKDGLEELDLDNMLTKYTIVDTINKRDYENHWYSNQFGDISKLDVDLINLNKTKTDYENYKPDILVSKDKPNLRARKKYSRPKFHNGNKNIVLENYEDWYGMGLLPNTTYKYKYGIYNYLEIEFKKDEAGIDIEEEVYTLPLNVSDNQYLRKYISSENKFEFECSYAKQGDMHKLTQEFNPLYVNIFRIQHNRTKDVLTKYINVGINQFIQLILPANSKYIFNKHSKPKFGNLYVYNIEENGSVKTQDVLMQEDKLYESDKYIIFYASNGENVNQLKGLGEVGIDYFTLGDNPVTIHKKVKFMVHINPEPDFKDYLEEEQIIQFTNEKKIEEYLNKNYINPEDKKGIYSTRKIGKVPLLEIKTSKNKEKPIIEYPEKINFYDEYIEQNRTYEYLMLIGNQKRLNPAANSFYMTSPAPKPYLLPIKDERLGIDKKNYLRIEWFTPKNQNIYWSYNFLLLRRIKKNAENIPIIGNSEGEIGSKVNLENFSFDKKKKEVQLKTGIEKETYIQEFNNEDDTKSWNIYFNIRNGKIKNGKPERTNFEYDVSVNGVITKHTYESDKKPKKLEKDTVYFAKSIILKVYMKEGDVLDNVSIKETVVKPEVTESLEGEEKSIFEAKKQKYKKQIAENNFRVQEFERLIRKAEIEKIKKVREKISEERSIGKFFFLEDDFEEGENNHFRGYTGELYYYLKEKNLSELYKIFDTLHEKILVYHGDITMRFDGPAGMLKSGSKDLIIDKIRYMALILKKGYQSTLDKLDIKCIDNKGLSGGTTCVTKGYLDKIKESKRKLKIEQDDLKTKILQNEENLKNMEEELKQKQILANTAGNNLDQEIEQKIKDIKNLKTQNEENEIDLEKLNNTDINIETGIPGESKSLALELFCKGKTEEECDYFKPSSDKESIMKSFVDELQRDYGNLKLSDNIEDFIICKSYGGVTMSLLKSPKTNKFVGDELREHLKRINSMNDTSMEINYGEITHIIYDKKDLSITFIYEEDGLDRSKIDSDEDESNPGEKNMIIIAKKNGSVSKQVSKREEAIKENNEKIDQLSKQINLMEKENEENPDIIAYKELLKKYVDLKNQNNNILLSDWSVIKHGLPDKQLSQYPTDNEVREITEVYSIHPTLHKLSGATRPGTHFFNKNELEKMKADKEGKEKYNSLEKTEFISHKHVIPLGKQTPQLYEYCILTYQTGFPFSNNNKRIFMGVKHLSTSNNQELNSKEGENIPSENFNFPNLNLGETYSDILEKGEEVVNTVVEQKFIPPPIEITKIKAPKPIIKLFKPKEGLQGSIVRIIGLNLDKIKYFCFRDVKVEVVRKGHTLIKETIEGKEQNSKYDEYLVRVPTLKQLGKVCWQSLRPYEVLVWGYFEKEGKQIRSSENENRNTNMIRKSIMFRYIDRTECPENEKLDNPQ